MFRISKNQIRALIQVRKLGEKFHLKQRRKEEIFCIMRRARKEGRKRTKRSDTPTQQVNYYMKLWKLRSGHLRLTYKEQNCKDISLRDPTRRVRNKQLLFKDSQLSREIDLV